MTDAIKKSGMSLCNCCEGEEDGIIVGTEHPLPPKFHTTLTEFFHGQLQHKKLQLQKPAVVCNQSQISFLELDHFSSAVAGEIQKQMGNSFVVTNPDEEILVGVCLPASEKIIPLIFAILKLGAAFLPLDPQLPEDLLLVVIHKFRPVMVITDDDGPILGKYDAKSFAEFTKLMSIEEIWLDMELPPDGDHRWKDGSVDKRVVGFSTPLKVPLRHRPAIVVPTTGVTGNPRGVRVAHMNVLHRINWEWRHLRYKSSCSSSISVPVYTVESFVQIFTSLLKGATIHIFKRNEMINMTNFIHTLFDAKVTRVSLTSNLLTPFLKAAKAIGRGNSELQHIRYVTCINDTLLPEELVKDFISFFTGDVALVNFYGGPEVGGILLYNHLKNVKDLRNRTKVKRVLLDRVMENCCIYILSDYLELLKDGSQGEICIAGQPVALGYVDMKEEEEHRFVDNPHDDREYYRLLFRTGDYGRIKRTNGQRTLFVEGRTDTQICVRGQQVVMDEVAELLRRNDKIQEAYIVLYEPSTVNQKMVGFVVPKSSALEALLESEVRGVLSNQIPEYFLPDIHILEEVPVVGANKRVSQYLLIRSYEEGRLPREFRMKLLFGISYSYLMRCVMKQC